MLKLQEEGKYTDQQINEMVRGGKLRGHIPGLGPVLPGYVTSRPSYSASDYATSSKVDFIFDVLRSDDRYSDHFARWESGGAGSSGAGSSGAGGSRGIDQDDAGEGNPSEGDDGEDADDQLT